MKAFIKKASDWAYREIKVVNSIEDLFNIYDCLVISKEKSILNIYSDEVNGKIDIVITIYDDYIE